MVVQIDEIEVPCHVLNTPVKTIVTPPMLEDLGTVYKDGKYSVFVATESGSYYYHGSTYLVGLAMRLISFGSIGWNSSSN